MTEKLAGQEVSSASQGRREAQRLREEFQKLYGQQARIFRAPGRVNLIGEHTDYNEGFVMPVAMDLYTWVAAALRKDTRVDVFSQNVRERAEMDLQHLNLQVQRHWSAYVLGVAASLRISGAEIGGANLLIEGKVPMGAGLSSSASVEAAAGYALLETSGLSLSRVELAKICQRAENEFAGARCGIMDQMIACCGRANYALILDCRTLGFQLLPLFSDAQFVVCNTMMKHDHATGEYNARRADCETATRILAEQMPEVRALRDVSLADLERYAQLLPEVVYRRIRHVISENARVLAARDTLERRDPESFGRLMRESQRSLKEDYEVSSAELDLLVEIAGGIVGVYGSRMTGGGFGGCAISLVRSGAVEEFQSAISRGYERAMGRKPDIYMVRASDGVREVLE